LVAEDMLVVKKMKKSELVELTKVLMVDNMRELHDETIVEMYEEQFETHLARY
jgi:septin family protein